MSDEEWRPVVGWEGLYEVSSLGRVKSLYNPENGRREYIREVSPSKSTGYLYVSFSSNGVKERRPIHRVVAQSFLPNPKGLPLVRHLNDVKTDNRVENLAWGTYRENGLDSVANGGHRMFSITQCPHGHPYDEGNTRINPLGRRECRICRKGWLEKSSLGMASRGLSASDPRHGTYSAYRHYKCRCNPCKLARKEYARGLRERKRESSN